MRVVRFRGKRIDNGEWVYGFYVEGVSNGSNRMLQHGILERGYYPIEVDQKTVGQDTGLKDKNGVEVFENDIVICDSGHSLSPLNPNSEIITGKVYQECYCWVVENNLSECLTPLSMFEVEVIGNIYDNPELLEVK